MSTNPFFESNYSDEHSQQLYESLVVECIQQYGRDYLYLPRTLVNYDELWGEDSAGSLFKDAAKVEMYLESTQGWEGEGEIISQFGIELRHEATLVIAKSRFHDEVTRKFNIKVPREGDLVVFPLELDKRKRIFEISYVEPEAVFYQLGKLYVYKIKVCVFEYSGEQFDTGIDHVDSYEITHSITQKIQLQEVQGSFTPGDIVTQKGFRALVISYNPDTLEIVLTQNEHESATSSEPNKFWPLKGESATGYITKTVDPTESIGNSDSEILLSNESIVLSPDESNPYLV